MSLNISPDDLKNLSETDKKELTDHLQNEAQKSSVQESIHQLTQMCFKKCITSQIRSGQLDRSEEGCVQNCVGRFMDSNMAVIKHLERMRTTTLG